MNNIPMMVSPVGDICTYSKFSRVLAETIDFASRRTNYHTKAMFNYANNESAILDESEEYASAMSNSSDCIKSTYHKLINSESDRLLARLDSLQKTIDTYNKVILNATCEDASGVVTLSDKFFEPKFVDVKDIATSDISKDAISNTVYGKEMVCTPGEICDNKTRLSTIVAQMRSNIIANRNAMLGICDILFRENKVSGFDDILAKKKECEKVVENFKSLMSTYDWYISKLEQSINVLTNKPVVEDEDKQMIHEAIVYDSLGLNRTFDDITIRMNYLNTQVEAAYIDLRLKALNESSTETKKSTWQKFIDMLKKILSAIGRFVSTIWQKWKQLIFKIQTFFDYYGKWAAKHKNEILNIISSADGYKEIPESLNVKKWAFGFGTLQFDDSKLKNITVIMPTIHPGSSKEAYEKAISLFHERWDRLKVGDHNESIEQAKSRLYDFIVQQAIGSKTIGNNIHAKKGTDNGSGKYATMSYVTKVLENSSWNKTMVMTPDRANSYINLMLQSKDIMKREFDKMHIGNIVNTQKADEKNLKNELARVSAVRDGETVDNAHLKAISEYYNIRRRVFSMVHSVYGDLYRLSTHIHRIRVNEAMRVLKWVLETGKTETEKKSNNESINLKAEDYIRLATLFEDSADVCMSSDLTVGGPLTPDTDISDVVGHEVDPIVAKTIEEKEIHPIAKLKDDSVLMKSDIGDTWVYDSGDKALTNQNTFERIAPEEAVMMADNFVDEDIQRAMAIKDAVAANASQ